MRYLLTKGVALYYICSTKQNIESLSRHKAKGRSAISNYSKLLTFEPH